jgi:hypothetical protein
VHFTDAGAEVVAGVFAAVIAELEAESAPPGATDDGPQVQAGDAGEEA